MRTVRVLVALLAVAAGVFLGAPPALAGNWVVTVLDPVPDRFESGRAYTIGFWALQHGSHPYEGTFESIGLEIVDANGNPLRFGATPLPEPAHYAAAVLVPRAGTWTVYGMHAPFQNYKIGTLTVPGGLAVLPVPQPMAVDNASQWGEIRPPTVPVDPNRGPFDDGQVIVAQPQAQRSTAAPAPASTSDSPAPTVLAILAATALLLGLVVAYRRRPTPGEVAAPPEPHRLDLTVQTPEPDDDPVAAGTSR